MKKKNTKFKPGQSGNPRGRPKGALNKTTMLAKALLDGQAEELVQALINKAIGGNVYALRLAIERLIPISRERAVSLPRSNATTSQQITDALQGILDAVGTGEITPGEAQKLSAILENKRKAIETAMLEERIAALETAPHLRKVEKRG